MHKSQLIIKGAKQNNLKNLDLTLPHDCVIAVTGVSGSGKSSLAFETIFAEGQWRFIESLSTYARLFLEKLDRPLVDSMENIRPAIALEQRNPVRGARSTVGTLTELQDFFRLLYCKASTPYCPECGEEIRKWDPSEATEELIENHEGQKALIVFESTDDVAGLKKKGFHRVRLGKEVMDLDEAGDKFKANGPVEVVLDRLLIKDEPRLSDSVESAWREGGGRLKIVIIDGPELVFSSRNSCDACGVELPEPTPLLFSFNHPVGACPECKGFGNVLKYAEAAIAPDKYLSLSEGAIEPWDKPSNTWWKKQMLKGAKKAGVDVKKPYMKLSAKEKQWVFKGDEDTYGVDGFFEYLEQRRYKLHVRVFLSRYRIASTCPQCGGRRLSREALAYKVSGINIAELSDMPIADAAEFFNDMELSLFKRDMAAEVIRQVEMKLGFLKRVGLGYLGISRQGRTLSGGEYQRVNLSNQLASRLTGTLYVLDEPTVGLHRRDTERVSEIMAELAAMGNTIVVVEHDKGIIESSDWVVELGPGGGSLGGNLVFSGPIKDFTESGTLTARYLRGGGNGGAEGGVGAEDMRRVRKHRKSRGSIVLRGARGHNLKDVTLDIPLGMLTTITGVSGSGKSSLVVETLYKGLFGSFKAVPEAALEHKTIDGAESLKGVKLIDQAPIGKSPRSNPVTYLKVFEHIRRIFAAQPESKARGHSPGFFSFSVPGGRCTACDGEGAQKVEMYFFEDLYVRCEDCGGTRYGPEALRVAYRGKNISDVLDMTVSDARVFFDDVPKIKGKLALMQDVGLGYLRLGQPAPTLSGGEAQRLKICAELGHASMRDFLYVLDEPTVGLHFKDVKALLDVLDRLVDAGNTVVVIEHNFDVVDASDWVVDLGPEGGDAGGEIVFEGMPRDIANEERSYTGRYFSEYMKERTKAGTRQSIAGD